MEPARGVVGSARAADPAPAADPAANGNPAGTAVGSAGILVASNRGPVAFHITDDGGLQARRGGGGLVSGLQDVAGDPDLAGDGMVWVCAALSEADRRACRSAPDGRLDLAGYDTGGAVRMLDVDRVVFDHAYNAVANRTLWFIQHLLYATPRDPVFGPRFRRDWEAYETYNEMFARALAAEARPGAAVLVQDYHLTLVPGYLRALRPDLRIAHFTHTPWAPPAYFRLLPDDVAQAVVGGMLGADRVGFLAPAWAAAFQACCQEVLGATSTSTASTSTASTDTGEPAAAPPAPAWAAAFQACCQEVLGATSTDSTDTRQPAAAPPAPADVGATRFAGRTTRVGVHPLGVDGQSLTDRAAEADVRRRAGELRDLVGDRRVVVRVDRTELSKNIVRGLEAYRELLRTHPRWIGRVVHIVCAYPSRQDLPEYREYKAAVQRVAQEIVDEFATDDWVPLRLEMADDYARSLAALTLAEVLVVNPIRDGMNLVAKEGPVLSAPGAALVLSREAGACIEMHDDALVVNPFDITATADAMHAALSLPAPERRSRSARLAEIATRLPPRAWFREQLDALRT